MSLGELYVLSLKEQVSIDSFLLYLAKLIFSGLENWNFSLVKWNGWWKSCSLIDYYTCMFTKSYVMR